MMGGLLLCDSCREGFKQILLPIRPTEDSNQLLKKHLEWMERK